MSQYDEFLRGFYNQQSEFWTAQLAPQQARMFPSYYDRGYRPTFSERERMQLDPYRREELRRMFNPEYRFEVTTAKPKQTWLDEAKKLTEGERNKAYGHPLPNFIREALAYVPILDKVVSPLIVAQMHVASKQMREVNGHKDDNWIDTIGYAATVQMMENRMQELRYAFGMNHFRGHTEEKLLTIMYEVLKRNSQQFDN